MEKNGIVDLENLFNMSPEGTVYNREDDIIPSSKSSKKDSVEEGKEGGSLNTPDAELLEEPTAGQDVAPAAAGSQDGAAAQGGEQNEPVVEDFKKDYFLSILKSLSQKKIIPPLEEIVFADENGEEINVLDMDISSPDVFADVVNSILSIQKDELMQDKIDVSSVSDLTRKLIQAEKQGVNIVEILKQYDKTNAPLENIDMENKKDQLKVIRCYIESLNLPKEEAEDFYNSIVEKGDDYIEVRAIRYKSELDKQMDKMIQDRTKAAQEKRQQDAEDMKRYKKNLKASIQSKFQLNDNMVNKIMDFILKPSKSDPAFSEANVRIKEILTDPEQAPDLLLFLMSPEEFIKQKSNKKVIEEKKRIYKMIASTTKDRTHAPVDDEGNEVRGKKFEEVELRN